MRRIWLPFKVLRLKAFRAFGLRAYPINFTISVTNKCNSRCKTCNIWRIYEEKPEIRVNELSLDEYERIFESIGGGNMYWVTLSGGEPFLRRDLVDIFAALLERCSPRIVNIPTNATLPSVVERRVREMLELTHENRSTVAKAPTLILNLSLDGIGAKHDEIRGFKGNFSRFMETYRRLIALKEEFCGLKVGIHTVISVYNVHNLREIMQFVRKLGESGAGAAGADAVGGGAVGVCGVGAVDGHIFEVAEEREELLTVGSGITPSTRELSEALASVVEDVAKEYLKGDFLSRLTQAFRLEYYEVLRRVLEERRQVVPCFAGFASCQISPYGDVWACCVLGSSSSFGNLRDADYDFKSVWYSERANEIRRKIKAGACYCPLANASYTNMLCHFPSAFRVLLRILKSY
ncbi:MAG: radical SAM protein [Candidatus Methanospirare jalkutatii]|nr:radical SAM protein [Candidatus Methanospirare jalkutatii]